MTCKHCNKAIVGKSNKRYCSEECRNKAFRGRESVAITTPESVAKAIVTVANATVGKVTVAKVCTHTGECLSKEDWEDIFKENMSANYYSKACPSSYEMVEKPLANE